MNRSHRLLAILAAFWLTACHAANAASPRQVDQAILQAKQFLYSQQNSDGNWESSSQGPQNKTDFDTGGGQWGGLTALSTYALLAGGDRPRDSRLHSAIHFLEDAPITGVYALGLRSQVWQFLPTDQARRKEISRDGQLLLHAMQNGGMFGYRAGAPNSDAEHIYDHSVSQYGVLGMWALQEQGLEVPDEFWASVDAGWRRDQHSSGGWSYYARPLAVYPETVSMTAAGVASLFLTDDYLRRGGLRCDDDLSDPDIERGLAWIGDHFTSVFDSPNRACYGLYAIERIGAASGHKFIGSVDWYSQGADYLLDHQSPQTGAWDEGDGPVADTALALLFLVHGRAPVVMNKLDYASSGWNRRPRDVAHLTRWISQTIEAHQPLNWQTVNIDSPEESWHDAPILYVCGNQPLHFSPEQERKLRLFAENGGLIWFNCDCGTSESFARSVADLGRRLFHAEFRPVPPNSPIRINEEFLTNRYANPPTVLGLSNGARELMIMIPDADFSAAWQVNTPLIRPEAFELAANIFLYAVDKEHLRFKGESYLSHRDPAVAALRIIKIARLNWGPGWDPEPGGWRRIAAVLHNQDAVDLNVDEVTPGDGTLLSGGYKIAHWTGTAECHLSPAARKEIQTFVEDGGTLIVDDAGGARPFADSARDELGRIFGARAIQLDKELPVTAPLYADGPDRIYGRNIQLRTYARLILGSRKRPRLSAIEFNARYGVYFSRLDLSVGLVGQPVDGIVGYTPELATKLMERMILATGESQR